MQHLQWKVYQAGHMFAKDCIVCSAIANMNDQDKKKGVAGCENIYRQQNV